MPPRCSRASRLDRGHPCVRDRGHQAFFFGVQIDLIRVYKVVVKTGLNLVAHFYGDGVLRHPASDRTCGILLEEIESNGAATICQMSPGFTSDFPRSGRDVHQMTLDELGGSLRFQMQLYNRFVYTRDAQRRRTGHCERWLGRARGRTVTPKVKFNDFEIITRSRSVPVAVSSFSDLENWRSPCFKMRYHFPSRCGF
jgi:hypothetical protein